jgi:hypothetical protein
LVFEKQIEYIVSTKNRNKIFIYKSDIFLAWLQSRQESGESPSQPHSSPVRQSSIFGALTKPKISHESLSHGGVGGVEEEGHHQMMYQVQILHV